MRRAAKRQRVDPLSSAAAVEPEALGRVWLRIFPQVRVRRLLLLGATSRFFRQVVDEYLVAQTPRVHPAFARERKAVSLSNLLTRCFCCHRRTMAELELVPMHLCQRCRGAEPRVQTISPTETKRRFHLKQEQLDDLPCVRYWLQEYRQLCKAYLLSDVEQRALEHYGSAEALAAVQHKSDERKAKLAATRQRKEQEAAAARAARRLALREALAERGLELREDGLLHCDHVETGEPPLAQVLETVHRNTIVYEQCNFEARWKAYRDRQPWMSRTTLRETRRRMRDALYEQWRREHGD